MVVYLSSSLVTWVFLYAFLQYSASLFFSLAACSSLLNWWKALGSPPGNFGGNFSVSSCCWILWYSLLPAGITSPRHIHGIRRWHLAPGLLKSQAAQTVSSTIADGCNLLVRMMLGYIAPTSKWYMMGFSSLAGQSLKSSNLAFMSSITSSKLVTSLMGTPSSTSIARFMHLSASSCSIWNADGTMRNLQGISALNTPHSIASTWPPTYVSDSSTLPSSDILLSTVSCLLGNTMLPLKASTQSRASHRVPLPFLKTSSGSIGMMVQRA